MKGNCSNCDRRLSHQNRSGVCRSCQALAKCAGNPIVLPESPPPRQALEEWCPLEYRIDYKRAQSTFGYSAKEARQMIEDQIQRDLAAYRATGKLQRCAREFDKRAV